MKSMKILRSLKSFFYLFSIFFFRQTQLHNMPLDLSQIGLAHQQNQLEIPLPPDEQTISFGFQADCPNILNPYMSFSSTKNLLYKQIFEGLLDKNNRGELVPACAESWSYDEKLFRWTFKLRPDLRWSDGSPLRADDFVRGMRSGHQTESYPHGKIPPSAVRERSLFNLMHSDEVLLGKLPIEKLGVWADDDHTLIVQLDGPFAPTLMIERFISPLCIPIKADFIQAGTTLHDSQDLKKLVVNGPFVISDIKVGSYISFKKNPYFWDAENLLLEELIFKYFGSNTDALQEWETHEGKVDICALEESNIAQVDPKYFPYISEYQLACNLSIIFNLREPELQEVRTRQAINLLIDRDRLSNTFVLKPKASLYGNLYPGLLRIEYIRPDWSRRPMKWRINEAKRLLEAAGYGKNGKGPFRLDIDHMSTDHASIDALTGLLNVLPNHLEVKFVKKEDNVLSSQIVNREYKAFCTTMVNASFNPLTTCATLQAKPGSNNIPGYSDPEYNEIVRHLQRSNLPPEEVEAHLHRLEQLIWRDVPEISLLSLNDYYLVNEHIGGWALSASSPISPHGIINFKDLFRKVA